MSISRRLLLGSAAVSSVPLIRSRAQGRPVIKLGVLTDLSGTYRDNTGPTSLAATQLAIEEMKSHVDFDVDLIIIGSHGRSGISRLLLGSTAERVVAHARCPVLVVKGARLE